MARYNYRRRLGAPNSCYGGKCRPYLDTISPVPYNRKRKPPPASSAPLRMGRNVRRRTGTMTRTKQQQKQNFGKVSKIGENSSISSTYFGSKRVPQYLNSLRTKLLPPQSQEDYATYHLTTSTGKQSVNSFSIMSSANLFSIFNVVTGGAAGGKSCRFILRSGKEIYSIRNQTNTNARMVIYDIYALKDSQVTSIDTPVEAWVKGITDLTGTTYAYNPGQTPFKSPEFRNMFRVYKATYVNLEPGQQHEHQVHHTWNRIVDSSRFENSTSSVIAGLSRFVMIVMYGHLIHESTASTTISTAALSCDVARFTSFSWAQIQPTLSTLAIGATLPTTIVDPDQMGETGDADVNVNMA